MDSLQRFVSDLPALQRLLSVPVTSQREAVLRAEMRRTIGALSVTLGEAARDEASSTRAALFSAASTAASRLAATPPASLRNH